MKRTVLITLLAMICGQYSIASNHSVFDDFTKDCSERGISVSKAQLYKSIKILISKGIIEKLGGQRSGLYTFVE